MRESGTTNTDHETGTVFLDLGGVCPHAKLTIVIFEEDLKNFPEHPEEKYRDKVVCVTGTISKYKERYQVVVKNKASLKLP